ncbi:MAG TPA: 2'-5' RNA ligase family protein [Sphingomicrobium sp.]|jgi:2'-5' RNA ligase|nr:2'-5' RNA ligase family protein [Sphingomicrobium sp.]
MAGALIVTAEIAPLDFSWLQGLRQAHYPAERNQVPAHLTMFHALPPSVERELCSRLARIVHQRAPAARIAGLMDLGGGVAFRVVSADLDRMREELAADLHGLLSAQDSGGWTPHVTIQNKVAPKVARALKESLESSFEPRSLRISGFAIHQYLEGPWAPVADYPFRP